MGTVLVFWTKFTQHVGEILFCPDVSAGHFQKLFRTLVKGTKYISHYVTGISISMNYNYDKSRSNKISEL